MIPSYDTGYDGIPPDGFMYVLTIIITIIIVVITMGFAVNLHASNCAMPNIKIVDKTALPYVSNCPSICDCNNTYDECQVSSCDYTRYWISWYNIGIIHK